MMFLSSEMSVHRWFRAADVSLLENRNTFGEEGPLGFIMYQLMNNLSKR
jgi:hypothetical protein